LVKLLFNAGGRGLNSDKLGGRNCTIRTERLAPESHKVIVSIGTDTVVPFGGLGNFSLNDLNNTLFENEMLTHLHSD
jgi:hypothetical protein